MEQFVKHCQSLKMNVFLQLLFGFVSSRSLVKISAINLKKYCLRKKIALGIVFIMRNNHLISMCFKIDKKDNNLK